MGRNDFGLCMNPRCNGRDYLCGRCRKLYPSLALAMDQKRRERKNRGGTYNSSAFRSVPQRNNPAVINHYFNGPGDGLNHGHVKEIRHSDGTVEYPYTRDVEGRETNNS
jgi:hypothetical protein